MNDLSWSGFAKANAIPLYETESDREREAAVAQRIQARIRGKLHRLAQYSIFDYEVVEDNKVTSLAEIKTRTCRSDQYATYYLNQKKIMNAHCCETAGLPVDLFVHWSDDKIGWLRFSRIKPDFYTRSGRTDRGDPQDYGVVGHYKIDKFHML